MTRILTPLAVLLLGAVALTAWDSRPVQARPGGSSFMDSPGYQRRLQESRGQVTNQSGSLTRPYTRPPAVYPRQPVKKRRR